jgi:hypothetical protein
MILKMTNRDKNFYSYMGGFFGSRIVQSETKDRIYDDNSKLWYVYVGHGEKAYAFVSVCDDVIKNVYSKNGDYLQELLTQVTNDIDVKPSVVTNLYSDLYKQCGFNVDEESSYKNFITITRGDKN